MGQRSKATGTISLKFLCCLALIFASISYSLAAQNYSKNFDHRVALLHLKEATELWKQGREIEVRSLLNNAAEYGGEDFADYWFLEAQLLSDKWQKSKLNWLEKALKQNNWRYTEPLSAALQVYKILSYWRMNEEIIRWYESWPRSLQENKEIRYYLAQAYSAIGERRKAHEIALDELNRQASNEQFFRILIDGPKISDDMWLTLHLYLENSPPESPSLLRYLISKSTDTESMQNLLAMYTSLFGDDYFTTAYRLFSMHDDLASRSDIFFRNYQTADFLILDRVFRSIESFRPLSQSMTDLNGIYLIDKNYDGQPEEELTFLNGQLTHRNIKAPNIDAEDQSIFFNTFGEPNEYQSFYNKNGNSRVVKVLYGRYPFVSSVQVEDADSRREYLFNPGKLQFSLTESYPIDQLGWVESKLLKPELIESKLASYSSEIHFFENLGKGANAKYKFRARYLLDRFGNLQSIEDDPNLDGNMEEVLEFRKQKPYQLKRDANRDGIFEVQVDYDERGTPFQYQVDTNNDGNFDYSEQRGDALIKTWYLLQQDGLDKPAQPIAEMYSIYLKWSRTQTNLFSPELLD